MVKGFMEVAVRLITEFPGETAEWYATVSLERGLASSDAKNPVQSLTNTLEKQVREGRERRVRRERIEGKFRYFPIRERDVGHMENIVIQILLSTQEMKILDDLTAVGKCSNRSDAIMWLAREGIKAKRDYLNKVADIRKQIEQIKSEVL